LSILVRNLPKTFTKENLEDLFFEFGTIASCDLVMDEASGLSKGFGFVEMSTQEETDKAIEKLISTVRKFVLSGQIKRRSRLKR